MNDFITDRKDLIIDFAKDNNLTYVGLFGSYARGEQNKDSDVDFIVEYETPVNIFGHTRLERKLSEKLGITVEMTTKKSLKKNRRPYIEKDLFVLYEK